MSSARRGADLSSKDAGCLRELDQRGDHGVGAPERARLTAFSVLHETLHGQFSSPAPEFRHDLASMDPRLQNATELLFNLIEDGRIHHLGLARDDGYVAAVATMTEASIEQLDRRSNTSGSGPNPTYPSSQLIFGLMAYALDPDHECELHPAVAARLAELTPLIDATAQVRPRIAEPRRSP